MLKHVVKTYILGISLGGSNFLVSHAQKVVWLCFKGFFVRGFFYVVHT